MAILEDNEIRDIRKYLEAGKPLPEKYRFLLFEEKKEVELVWNGKTNEVTNVVLPFQIIEQIDEPRAEANTKLQLALDFGTDERGRQLGGWTNKLIWGDNKLILSSLKNGPLREEIEAQGGIKLIYIDPPFDVGADFSMNIEIGDEQFTKQPSVLEELAYRDTWGKGADSFIAMIYERLSLMKDLLADDGSIYVHCDWRVSAFIRIVLDEIFGNENILNEIIWSYKRYTARASSYQKMHDTIFFFSKTKDRHIFNQVFDEYQETTLKYHKWEKDENGKEFYWKRGNNIDTYKIYKNEGGVSANDVWNMPQIGPIGIERQEVGYPTQKPEILSNRIIRASSNEGDLVADLFCGSGTTLSVAEKLGRKWIGADLGKFAIHTTRKRMIEVQRQMKKDGKDYRAFEILNLGKYERQHYIGVNLNLREEEKQKQLEKKEKDFVDLIIKAYKAESSEGFKTFQAKKNNRLVSIGPINLPVTRLFAEEVIAECLEKQITKVDILAFEFEMGLSPNMQEEAKSKGVDLVLKYIPREVFDKRAIEKNQVVFNDVSYIEIKPIIKGLSVAVELTDFSVFYNQDTIVNVEENLKSGSNKILVENGQIIKVSKDRDSIMTREVLTKKWTDWVDYWAVDFNYESKKEVIRVQNEDAVQVKLDGSNDPSQLKMPEYKEVWSGDYIFENEWQSFRTKKDRSIQLKSVFKECPRGRRKIAVKVVDIFGNDTMKVVEVNI